MKALLSATALVSLLTISAQPAGATDIRGIDVVNLGHPRCAEVNPAPFSANGFYQTLRGDQPQLNLVDPYKGTAFAGSPYSAVVGPHGSPGSADYVFDTPQQVFIVMDGTPDPSDRVEFFYQGHLLGLVTGDQMMKNFGAGMPYLNMRFHIALLRPFDEVRLVGELFEIANVNAVCAR